MARIRTIKPEFWADEKLGPLPPLDRLVFLGLVSQADDAGRLIDNVRLIDGLLFPLTHDTSARSLVTLASLGVIERGLTASGQPIIQIVGWTKHQKVDHPRRKACLPPIVEQKDPPEPNNGANSREPRESLARASREIPEDVATLSRSDLRPSTFDLTTNDQRPATDDREDPNASASRAADPAPTEPPGQPPGHQDAAHEDQPQPQDLGGYLERWPDIAELVAGLQHDGSPMASARAIESRYLYDDGDDVRADDSVTGLPIDERERLVHTALLEYATQPEPWTRPLFSGFVRRLRETRGGVQTSAPAAQPYREPEVEVTPEQREEIARLARERAAELKPGAAKKGKAKHTDEPKPDQVVHDPEVVAQREAEKQHQRRLLEGPKAEVA